MRPSSGVARLASGTWRSGSAMSRRRPDDGRSSAPLPGLTRILLKAGIEELPIPDRFHLAMRLRHLTRVAGSLSSDHPERAAAKMVVVEEVEHLRWRLWNGK